MVFPCIKILPWMGLRRILLGIPGGTNDLFLEGGPNHAVAIVSPARVLVMKPLAVGKIDIAITENELDFGSGPMPAISGLIFVSDKGSN